MKKENRVAFSDMRPDKSVISPILQVAVSPFGLTYLPSGHAELVQHALHVYTKDENVCFPAERTIPFAHDLLKEIRELHACHFEEQASFSPNIH